MTGIKQSAQMNDADKAEARRLYEKGLSLNAVGVELGRHYGAVGRALRSQGVVLRSRSPITRLHADLRTRLLSRAMVNPETNCWEWAGAKDSRGYGYIKHGGIQHYVHREAYEMWFGPIPAGLEIDHLCVVPCCLNPDHLEAVTPRVNTLRSSNPAARNARKTHCDNKHEFTPENTYTRADGYRGCVKCKKASYQDYPPDGGDAA